MADLAREVGWSHLAIKGHLSRGAGLHLATVAAECGYVDQSHLNRDWQQFAGTSPTRWLREDQIVFVQDDDPTVTPS